MPASKALPIKISSAQRIIIEIALAQRIYIEISLAQRMTDSSSMNLIIRRIGRWQPLFHYYWPMAAILLLYYHYTAHWPMAAILPSTIPYDCPRFTIDRGLPMIDQCRGDACLPLTASATLKSSPTLDSASGSLILIVSSPSTSSCLDPRSLPPAVIAPRIPLVRPPITCTGWSW